MSDHGTPESHGVHGADREDGKMQEEPSGTDGSEGTQKAQKTETGGDAT